MGRTFAFHLQEPAGSRKPWVILIHGLGMSQRSWIDPFAEGLLQGAISFDYVLTDVGLPPLRPHFPKAGLFGCSPPLRLSQPPLSSFWERLKGEGYGVLAWSQGKPHGPIVHAVEELQEMFSKIPQEEKIVLLGHSRGGLIARRYLQDRRTGWERVAAVLLLGVPHYGSSLAKGTGILDRFLSRFGRKGWRHSAIKRNGEGRSLYVLIRNLAGLAGEKGIAELTPRSAFLRGLAAGEREERKMKIPYLNIIGTRTDFTRIYLRSSRKGRARPFVSLFDGLEKILPGPLVPLEIRQGRGDGQVSVKSAGLPWAEKNILMPVNHAQFLVDKEVQNRVQEFIAAI